MNAMTLIESQAYICSLKNPLKRAYADAYRAFLGGFGPQPERGELSYMAAQAVRLKLNEMLECP